MIRLNHSTISNEETNNALEGFNEEPRRFIRVRNFFKRIKDFLLGVEMKKTPVEINLLKTKWIFGGTKDKEKTEFDDLLGIF